jgi:hypothetical protein
MWDPTGEVDKGALRLDLTHPQYHHAPHYTHYAALSPFLLTLPCISQIHFRYYFKTLHKTARFSKLKPGFALHLMDSTVADPASRDPSTGGRCHLYIALTRPRVR